MIYIVLALITVFFSSCSSLNINFPKEEVVSKKVLEKKTVLTLPSDEIAGDLLVYRPDSKELISTVKDNLLFPVYIWDMQTKTLRKKLDKKEFKIANYSDIIFSDDSKKLLFSSQLNLKKEYDFKTRKRIYRHINHFGEIDTYNYEKLTYHRYNDYPAYENEVIDTVFGKKIVTKKVMKTGRHTGGIFLLTSKYLLTGSYYNSLNKDRGLVFYDSKNFKLIDIEKEFPIFSKIAISPDRKYLLLSNSKYHNTKEVLSTVSVKIYDIESRRIINKISKVYKDISLGSLSFLDENHILVSPSWFMKRGYRTKEGDFHVKKIKDKPIKLINIHTKKEELFYEQDYGAVKILEPIGNKYLISYSLNKSLLLVWDRKTRKILQKIEFGKRALGLTISPDKTEIAISYANKIYLYKVNSI